MSKDLQEIIQLIKKTLVEELDFPESDLNTVIDFYHDDIKKILNKNIANKLDDPIKLTVKEIVKKIKEDEDSYYEDFYQNDI